MLQEIPATFVDTQWEQFSAEPPRRHGWHEGPVITAPSHTYDAFDPLTLPGIVQRAAKLIRHIKPDAILCCGHSGLLVAGAVSYVTRVPVIAVRKPGEQNIGSDGTVTAVLHGGPAERWVWLDDFIAQGRTLRHAITEAHREECITDVFPAAVLLYRYEKSEGDQHYNIGDDLRDLISADMRDEAHCPLHGLRA
jgi:adenine/guanine phosphoribosyltransferase-like PRPP-binding protein